MSAENQKLVDSATTCVVGCKLPHGMKLELFNKHGHPVASHVIKGMNDRRIVGGYGLTDGIPTEFMTEWLKRNSQHPAVINGSIFMHSTARGAEARAREGREVRTGIEPINPLEDAARFKIAIDAEAERAYRRQVAENPARNRQIVE